ncbi:MAG: hypothetical protein LUH00_09010 [Lachnospiraceae bacterium]|nr:hypothetical protein [Lachnospiraceae bacterium]
MPEYRRFVAYFYEYIDEKKQGNAGFAKVELRNGMWRVLFRLTLPVAPEPPVRVYGFVREQGYQAEFPLGIMNADPRGPEEWAWRADAPVGSGKYYFDQITGIRIQSGDERVFLTVWDDEPVEMDRFVAENSGEQIEAEKKSSTEAAGADAAENPEGRTEAETRRELSGEQSEKLRGTKAETPGHTVSGVPEISSGTLEKTSSELSNRLLPEKPEISGAEVSVQILSEPMEESGPEMPMQESMEIQETAFPRMPATGIHVSIPVRFQKENPAECLLQRRQAFHPFEDDEFFDCVQIKLCDLLPLQQEGWQVGRSNFLQHGYYLYRHLLLGRAKDGFYVVGVPGLRSQQEEYVAHTFGYDRFKLSGLRSCGRKFGYWCRVLDDSGFVKDVCGAL